MPLTFTLLMKACLSESPAHRPSFAQTVTILKDLGAEVQRGHYINSDGWLQVRCYPTTTVAPLKFGKPLLNNVMVFDHVRFRR